MPEPGSAGSVGSPCRRFSSHCPLACEPGIFQQFSRGRTIFWPPLQHSSDKSEVLRFPLTTEGGQAGLQTGASCGLTVVLQDLTYNMGLAVSTHVSMQLLPPSEEK